MEKTIVGVDLAKRVIQVCLFSNKKVQSNTDMTPAEFTEWLATTNSATIVFEGCGTSNYWKQKAISLGHDARLISTKLISAVRQNHKTDKNDALAIVQATLLPDVSFIPGKSTEQQQLQSILRLRELCIKQKTAAGNQLKALLSEFNIKISNRNGGLNGAITATLEDAENGLSVEFRAALFEAWQHYLSIVKSIAASDGCLEKAIEKHDDCKKLLKIEGVGVLDN